jgi:MFS family permease
VAIVSIVSLMFIKDSKKKPFRGGLVKGLRDLPPSFRTFLIIATLFALADFTYMFFILRAKDFFESYSIPVLLYIIFNTVYALLAFPAGIVSDKIGRKKVLIYGYALFILTCISFIYAKNLPQFIIAFSLYGLAYALIVGNERAFASDLAPKKEMGTAMGTFHTFIAVASLPGSLLAGYLWQYQSHTFPFFMGTALAIIALLALATSKNLEKK